MIFNDKPNKPIMKLNIYAKTKPNRSYAKY